MTSLSFSSVRKRMSVVVRCPDGQVKIMSKGADTTMVPLLREDTPEVTEVVRTAELAGMGYM